MPKWNNKQLAMIAILLDEEEENNEGKRLWINNIIKSRKSEGEYHTLFKQLKDDETSFYVYFRMSKYEFYYLLDKIRPNITKQDTLFREAITAEDKLMVCLRFLATGDSVRTIAFSYRLGHSTVHNIIKDVCEAIIKIMLGEVMPVPTENQWKTISKDFWNKWNFPNCLGAIDGKHVEIVAPPNSGSQYFNYKHTFSIVLMALVDANCKFIAVDVGSYGKNSDGGIFAHSNFGKALELNKFNVPKDVNLPSTETPAPYVIVGDEAFPLKRHLMRPYPGNQIKGDIEKQVFNYRLSRARRVSENAFGILAQKFRIYFRTINALPENIDKIILTTCILHNYIKHKETIVNNNSDPPERHFILTDLPRQGGSCTSIAFSTREMYKNFFNSPNGSVPWQTNNIF